ncbi:hypothetical protein [Dyadobacter sp. CY343]|uniref:hypothetical protein n=1 Tax=Dyadobacter sp. CY343 TaxID=2907299 RepID=UPI001F320906|nr:hypothetical protein [Dyadobacter sp. CY343]MCE7060780.1 hypothetical protein [Dyadobacter sp. CY343]
MIKAFRKNAIPLLLLLLSGHFFVTASAHEGIVQYAQQKVHQAGAALESNFHHHNLLPGFGIGDRKSRDKVFFEEKEEENPDLFLPKTYSCYRGYFTDFYKSAIEFRPVFIAKCITPCTHWLRSSTRRYLILRVFRI